MGSKNLILLFAVTLVIFLEQGRTSPTNRDNEREGQYEQATSPLMMFNEGTKGNQRRRVQANRTGRDRDPNRANPINLRYEDESGSGDHSSTAARGEWSQGNGIAEGGSELDSNQGNRDGLIAPNQDQLTLDHFQAALESYPEAERFIILTHENGTCSIEPRAADPNPFGPSRGENMQVINTLRTLIPSEVADDLLKYNNSAAMSLYVNPLSALRLRAILGRIVPVVELIEQLIPAEEIPVAVAVNDQIARTLPRAEVSKATSLLADADLETSVRETAKKVAQAQEQLARASSLERDELLFSVRQAEAEWIRAKTHQAHHTTLLELEKLGETGKGDKIKEFGAQIETARAKAVSSVNDKEAAAWNEVVSFLEKRSQYFINCVDAFVSEKEELAKEYSKIIDELQKMATYKIKVAQAYRGEAPTADKEELSKVQSAALATERCIGNLIKSATCLEKKQEAILSHDQELADNWDRVVLTYQRASENDIVSAHMYEKGDEAVAKMFGWGDEKLHWGASCCIKRAAENLEKATVSLERLRAFEATGNNNVADTLREIISLCQQAAQHCNVAAEVYVAAKESEGSSWYCTGISLQSKADYEEKAIEAFEARKIILTNAYCQAAATSQAAADQSKQATSTKTAGKESEGMSWHWASVSLQAKADYEARAAEAEEAGKTAPAEGYRQAAASSQAAADHWKQSASTKAAGKESEGGSHGWVGKSLQSKADYEAKAAEAVETGKIVLAEGYRQAAASSQAAADQWKQSVSRKVAGQESEGNSHGWVAKSLQSKADYEAKAAEAVETGKIVLAVACRQAVAISQATADQHQQATLALAGGKDIEFVNWHRLGRSLQSKADYEIKIAEAIGAGKKALADGYRQAVVTFQVAADHLKQAASEYSAGKKSDGNHWILMDKSLQSKADYEAKAAEAEEAGKKALADIYRKAVATSQATADHFKQTPSEYSAGKKSEGNNWILIGKSLQLKADYEAKAAEAVEARKAALADGYCQAAATSQSAADQLKQAVSAYTAGKSSEGASWSCEGMSLQSKADYEAKAVEAVEARKAVLAAAYRQATATLQAAADQMKQAALAYAAGKEIEGNHWIFTGKSLTSKADCEAKAAEAEEAGKSALASGYRQAAATSQAALGRLQQAASAYAAGKQRESISLQKTSSSLQSKADYEVKAAEAKEARKSALAEAYRQAAVISQAAVEAADNECRMEADQNAALRAGVMGNPYAQRVFSSVSNKNATDMQKEADQIVKKAESEAGF